MDYHPAPSIKTQILSSAAQSSHQLCAYTRHQVRTSVLGKAQAEEMQADEPATISLGAAPAST